MNHISRRAFGGLLASGASLAVLASTTHFALADSRIRLIWWGNPERDKRTNAVIDLYTKANAGVSYFYFSNIHTLSVIFDVPLESESEMAARRSHVEDVIMGYLRA